MLMLLRARCIVAAALALTFAAAPLAVTAAPADDAKAAVQRLVDGMNSGNFAVLSQCAGSATMVDDIPPYAWTGPGACTRWLNDLLASFKAEGTTAMRAAFDPPTMADVHDKAAYLVYPARFVKTTNGAQSTRTGVMTFVMELGADGWKFTNIIWSRAAQTP